MAKLTYTAGGISKTDRTTYSDPDDCIVLKNDLNAKQKEAVRARLAAGMDVRITTMQRVGSWGAFRFFEEASFSDGNNEDKEFYPELFGHAAA